MKFCKAIFVTLLMGFLSLDDAQASEKFQDIYYVTRITASGFAKQMSLARNAHANKTNVFGKKDGSYLPSLTAGQCDLPRHVFYRHDAVWIVTHTDRHRFRRAKSLGEIFKKKAKDTDKGIESGVIEPKYLLFGETLTKRSKDESVAARQNHEWEHLIKEMKKTLVKKHHENPKDITVAMRLSHISRIQCEYQVAQNALRN